MKESDLHRQVCEYLKIQYPKVLFNTDMSGIRLTIGQAIQAKRLRSGNGFPDLMILEPRGAYCGLFIELKKETPYLKSGLLKHDKHLAEQEIMISELVKRGYFATFAWKFEHCKMIIDVYLTKNLE
jgi:hypothetical protein